jgi:hypothetical protein
METLIHKCLGKLKLDKLERKSASIRDICIQPHNFDLGAYYTV